MARRLKLKLDENVMVRKLDRWNGRLGDGIRCFGVLHILESLSDIQAIKR